MANTDNPRGFRPYTGVGGSACGRTRQYPVTGGTRIGKGAVVRLSGGVCTIMQGNPCTNAIGVSANFVSSSGSGRVCEVYNDPEQLFVGQTDGNDQETANEHRGVNFSIAGTKLFNTTWLYSKQELDGSATGLGSTTNIFHCVDISETYGNDATVSWTECIVKFVPAAHLYAKSAPPAALSAD